jgi:hypothetical protein
MPSEANTQSHFSSKNVYGFLVIDRAASLERITREDAELLTEFLAERRSCVGISVGWANKLSFTLLGWRRFIDEFSENTITDLYAGVPALKSGLNLRGRPFKQNTISDYVAILK